MPEQIEWLTVLFSMIQPWLQCVPIKPICSAVGGAQGGRRMPHREAAHRDEVPPGLVRVKHRAPHVDLDQLVIGIDPL